MPNERHYSNELNLESVGINLPYNMQAEQSVLGAVLLKPDTLTDLVEIIRPEMFYTRQNAQIYSEMLRLFTSDQTIDFVTLLDARRTAYSAQQSQLQTALAQQANRITLYKVLGGGWRERS